MDRFIQGVAVAALSALTFLAYKHPKAYDRLYMPLQVVMICVAVGSVGWSFGTNEAFKAIAPYLKKESIDAASGAMSQLSVSGWWLLGYVCVSIYLTFLTFLPAILSEEKPPKKIDSNEGN